MNPVENLQLFINRRRSFIGVFDGHNVEPTAHCNVEADMTRAAAYRKKFNEEHPEVRLTFNDMIIKAAANALPHHRLYTYSYNTRYSLFPADTIDIRFPVDLGDYLGWAMVKDTDKKTLTQIAADSKAAIERTRRDTPRRTDGFATIAGRHPIVPLLVQGIGTGLRFAGTVFPGFDRWARTQARKWRGTFLVTNVGPAGIMRMEGPIVAPDILHLMVTATKQTPVLVDGKVVLRPMMPLIAKYNVRMTDAAQTARFLTEVKENLEDPEHRLGPY